MVRSIFSSRSIRSIGFVSLFIVSCGVLSLYAEEKRTPDTKRQADLEAALSKMLSGATLEGSFTVSGPGTDPGKLSREKYTLGDVKKIAGDVWQFPARIEYGGKDITLPIPLPIRWAGDTPVVVVDEVDLPGFGSVSARVMFFEGHYAGFWKHGDHSGNLFGVIHSATEKADAPPTETRVVAPPHDNR